MQIVAGTTSPPAGETADASQIILGDCIIFENWSGALGGSGKSFNLYDSQRGHWQQTWVDDRGTLTQFTGEYRDGGMHYLAEKPGTSGSTTLRRMTLFNLDQNHVRQLGEQSADAGRTWTVLYDFMYTRKP